LLPSLKPSKAAKGNKNAAKENSAGTKCSTTVLDAKERARTQCPPTLPDAQKGIPKAKAKERAMPFRPRTNRVNSGNETRRD
jgi:hypothetical protein